jgi:hypothetical protein
MATGDDAVGGGVFAWTRMTMVGLMADGGGVNGGGQRLGQQQ